MGAAMTCSCAARLPENRVMQILDAYVILSVATGSCICVSDIVLKSAVSLTRLTAADHV